MNKTIAISIFLNVGMNRQYIFFKSRGEKLYAHLRVIFASESWRNTVALFIGPRHIATERHDP